MMATTEELSADEIALYDRQLRLWGMEAQNRMRKAKVLLITIKALGNEIAKNLVLAGIGSLTILDDAVLTTSDVESQFLVTKENIGQNVIPA
jgi:ubiquitin-like 1-activating enzyme E1 A